MMGPVTSLSLPATRSPRNCDLILGDGLTSWSDHVIAWPVGWPGHCWPSLQCRAVGPRREGPRRPRSGPGVGVRRGPGGVGYTMLEPWRQPPDTARVAYESDSETTEARSLHSHIPGPAHRPGVDKVHGAAISSPRCRISPGEVVVIAMTSVAESCTIHEGNGACFSSSHNGQPSQHQ